MKPLKADCVFEIQKQATMQNMQQSHAKDANQG